MTFGDAFTGLEAWDLLLFVVGVCLLGVSVLPRLLHDKPLSVPILVLGVGVLAWTLPLGFDTPDPVGIHGNLTEHLTEFGVIVSLMVAGLSIDRRFSWRGWASTWRLLAITMPLSVGAAALLGWWAGLVPATAALFGAVISPTDPVLGKDLEVGPPGEGAEGEETETHDLTGAGEEDEVRFALSAEAGLNDGLAFPYTNLAIAMAMFGVAPGNWFSSWVLVDVGYKVAVGIVLGWLFGRALGATILRFPADTEVARDVTGMAALAGTLLAFGGTEFVGGYGFLATFVAALTLRQSDRWNDYHTHLEGFGEQMERVVLVLVMLLFGGAIARGILAPLTWDLVLVALALVFVVRPLAGLAGLTGMTRSPWRDRAAISFYGTRGIGTFYYLSHGLEAAEFEQSAEVWAVASLVVLIAVVVHGMTAAPVLHRLDRLRADTEHASDGRYAGG
ncbi:MAG: cation:proton antiporter [Actinobacteria bacterium]|nr:cation:proton antiporter [Actinomycetota bacterium]